MFDQRPILFPTDFSACSLHALQQACDLACSGSCRLLILHVVETLGPENVTFGEAEAVLQPAGYRQRLLQDLQRVVPSDPDISYEHLVREGDPPRQIVAVAEERKCGLIVMGTYGRTGLKGFLMGGTTKYVVQHASCPVLTVKLPVQS